MTALVLAMLLAAIEATIVATAMPSIAAALGGFSLYGWVFSAYLLMQAVTTPIFGKLADLYGRKPVFLAGISIFLTGSALCALAPTMPWLIAFRLVQGTGAGAVLPIAITLAGDLYGLEERGKVQGYLSSVWGVSSVAGPLAGGLIVEHLGWPWIFWLNLPVGCLSALLMALCLRENLEKRPLRLDWLGAALLLGALSAFMLGVTLNQAALLLLAFLLGWAFWRQEQRAPDPVVHLELWREPIIWRGNLTAITIGIGMLGLIGFVPTYVQAVLGGSALQGGFALSAMCIGWPLAAVASGRLLLRTSVRSLVRCGSGAALAGALLIVLLAPRGALWLGIGSMLVGVGFGILNTSFLIAIQTSVPWERRGMATAGNMLARNLGNTLGASSLGALLNHQLLGYLRRQGLESRVRLDDLRQLVGDSSATLPAEQLGLLQAGLGEALHLVFWAVFAAVALGAAVSWGAPDVHLKKT